MQTVRLQSPHHSVSTKELGLAHLPTELIERILQILFEAGDLAAIQSSAGVSRAWRATVLKYYAPDLERLQKRCELLRRSPLVVPLPPLLRLKPANAFRFKEGWAVQDQGGSCHTFLPPDSEGQEVRWLGDGEITRLTDSAFLFSEIGYVTLIHDANRKFPACKWIARDDRFLILDGQQATIFDSLGAALISVNEVSEAEFLESTLLIRTSLGQMRVYDIETGDRTLERNGIGRAILSHKGRVAYEQDGNIYNEKGELLSTFEGRDRLLWADERTVIVGHGGLNSHSFTHCCDDVEAKENAVPQTWLKTKTDPRSGTAKIKRVEGELVFYIQTFKGTSTFYQGQEMKAAGRISPYIGSSGFLNTVSENSLVVKDTTYNYDMQLPLPSGKKIFSGKDLIVAEPDRFRVFPLSPPPPPSP